jgi:hypothetical protein
MNLQRCSVYVIMCERSVSHTCVLCTGCTENYPSEVPETHIRLGRTHLGRLVARVTKFCAVALNIFNVTNAIFPLQ